MKQLTDADIEQMIGGAEQIVVDDVQTRKNVRRELQLSKRIPHQKPALPNHATLDLHHFTEEQAWDAILQLAQSGIRTATIITGASGILKIKFQQWATDSVLSPYVREFKPINNGSFSVIFARAK